MEPSAWHGEKGKRKELFMISFEKFIPIYKGSCKGVVYSSLLSILNLSGRSF